LINWKEEAVPEKIAAWKFCDLRIVNVEIDPINLL
jgi:hypothetical protein